MESKHHILLAGGSGLIGSHLIQLLLKKGHSVSVLSRREKNIQDVKCFLWDVEQEYIDINALKNVTAILNLSGQGIADKAWSEQRKKELLKSRTKSTQLLFKTLANNPHTVATFINASAIGIYKSGNDLLDENSSHDNNFLATICSAWESESIRIQTLNIRTVIFRIGLVQSKRGGMLKEMLLPIKFFIAPVFGNGKQWQSWIHIDDLCRMMLFAIENKNIQGVYNAVANEPLTNLHLLAQSQAVTDLAICRH